MVRRMIVNVGSSLEIENICMLIIGYIEWTIRIED